MNNDKKKAIKTALITFIKACIPPFVALISSVLTTLISNGDVASATTVGSVLGIASGIITHA